MGKERPNGADKRLIVYVDAQLRYSKRFDPDGIRAEYPEFFASIPRRRSSGSLVSVHSERSNSEPKDEGQLRYWTSDMCSRSPHLFDFVVTVSPPHPLSTHSNFANMPHPLFFSSAATALSSSHPGSSSGSYPPCYPSR